VLHRSVSGEPHRPVRPQEGANADEDTTWPQGFDPKAAEVIFE
jgi:hypothetical protein